MFRKIIFAIILVMNHSLLLGAIQAAEMPDECHPYGHSTPVDHPEQFDSEQHMQLHAEDGTAAHIDCLEHNLEHDEHHQHGMHIHLSLSLPENFDLTVQMQVMPPPSSLFNESPIPKLHASSTSPHRLSLLG